MHDLFSSNSNGDIFLSRMMASPFKVTTIKVAGMNAPDKRAHIFNHLIQEGHDILALQESHCTNTNIKTWQDEW